MSACVNSCMKSWSVWDIRSGQRSDSQDRGHRSPGAVGCTCDVRMKIQKWCLGSVWVHSVFNVLCRGVTGRYLFKIDTHHRVEFMSQLKRYLKMIVPSPFTTTFTEILSADYHDYLSVSWFVCRITQKLQNWFPQNLTGGWDSAQNRAHWLLVQIQDLFSHRL